MKDDNSLRIVRVENGFVIMSEQYGDMGRLPTMTKVANTATHLAVLIAEWGARHESKSA